MDAKGLLDSLLNSGRDLAGQGKTLAEEKLGMAKGGPERDAMVKGLGTGALAAGALALLLGTGGGRRVTGTALKVGSLAAIGGLAYKAFKSWQDGSDASDPRTDIAALPEPVAQDRSALLVRAMIAAAKADGHIDRQEIQAIKDQVVSLGLEADVATFLMEEVQKPLDAHAIAAGSDGPETAAQIYLASRIIIDVESGPERAYLDELTQALELDPALVSELERQISGQ